MVEELITINRRTFYLRSVYDNPPSIAKSLEERGYDGKGYVVSPHGRGLSFMAYRTVDGDFKIP